MLLREREHEPHGVNRESREPIERHAGRGMVLVLPALLALVAGNLSACGDASRPYTPDAPGPSAVSDLRVTASTDSSLTLAWTAPGAGDDSAGAAAVYDLRFLTRPLDSRNWPKADLVDSLAAPGPAGAAETRVLTGLSPRTAYYVGLRSADDEGRWSTISNIAGGTTAPSPPALLWQASKYWFSEGCYPTEVAFAPDGQVYFSYKDESLAARRGYVPRRSLYLYNPATGVDQCLTSSGSWPGLALVPGGGFYTWDSMGIVQLGLDFKQVAHFGYRDGNAPGWIGRPSDVVVDDSGFVYVAGGSRIQKFTPDGTYVSEWHTPTPLSMALDGRGRLYVRPRYGPAWVYIYTTDGDSVGGGPVPGSPCGLGTDRDGNLYVAGGKNYPFVTELSPDLEIVKSWPVPYAATDVAVDAEGFLYVLVYGDPSVMRLSRDGAAVASWHAGGANASYETNWAGISIAGNGDVFVAANNFNAVRSYTSVGVLLAQWGTKGSGQGQFQSPVGVAPAKDGTVYVADYYNSRIQRFTYDGEYLSTFGNVPHDDWLSAPADLALDSGGNVYVADRGYQRIQKYDSDGGFLTTWGSPGSGPGQFNAPRGIAVDGEDHVFVWDTLNHRVQMFTPDGAYLREWQASAEGTDIEPPGSGPAGIAVDQAGVVYLSDRVGNRIVAFDAFGSFLGSWGELGSGPGQFYGPTTLTVGSEGQICVIDIGNKRLQTFANPQYLPR
jgi:sugar lactone lactonase YvrE